METLTLKQLLHSKSQQEVAEYLGVTQGAVSQMVKNKRQIFFEKEESGNIVSSFEKKYKKTEVRKSNERE